MSSFDEHLEDWRAYTAEPWNRIRYAVVRDVLAAHLGDVGAGAPRLDVLDVGGADGLDAAPLQQLGHRVTVLDPAEGMLRLARERGLRTKVGGLDDLAGRPAVDAVLCHYVLQYRPDPAADLRRLVQVLRPDGLLSVVLPNPDHRVLTAFLRQGPEAALTELEATRAPTLTFGTEVAKIDLPRLERWMAGAGMEVVDVFGGRTVGDLLLDNGPKADPDFYAAWERLEIALSRREPFRRLGQFYGVLARRAC
ncbi:class I SAM-dependent methyltransferase [Ornithinimicrobium sp. W1665]|uniref:class I SAM-dependent methyltransferase n=1 Tax=Ornithinimicrobium sp. W1665 TaxID=3416666 RepID=UPI003CEBFA88